MRLWSAPPVPIETRRPELAGDLAAFVARHRKGSPRTGFSRLSP